MSKVLAIDPGISKCGVIVADISEKKVDEAVVISSDKLLKYVTKKDTSLISSVISHALKKKK